MSPRQEPQEAEFEILKFEGIESMAEALCPDLPYSSLLPGISKNLEILHEAPNSLRATVVRSRERVVGGVLWAASQRITQFYDRPARFELSNGLTEQESAVVMQLLGQNMLDDISSSALRVELPPINFGKVKWVRKLIAEGARVLPSFSAEVHLEEVANDLSWVRKSYRSLIRKGSADRESVVMDKDNFEESRIRDFQAFHREIAGRKTRSDETWEEMGQAVQEDRAEVFFSYEAGRLVAATFVRFSNCASYYANGVYIRRPGSSLSHYPLARSILRAKERGSSLFFLGDVFDFDGSDKNRSISNFKLGFATSLRPFLILEAGKSKL